MKSQVQANTETFYFGNSNNTSISNINTDMKRSWCCNIPTCLDSGRFQAGKSDVRITQLKTDIAFDDFKPTITRKGERLMKRKLPRKSKGLNVKNKIRRTFTLCCTNGQNVSFDEDDDDDGDEDDEEAIDNRERGEDVHGMATADGKDSTEVQNWNEKKKDPELFWKRLNPFTLPHLQDDQRAACQTPTNTLNLYAADMYARVAPNNNGRCPLVATEYVNWQNLESKTDSDIDSDSSSSGDCISLSTDNLSSCSDTNSVSPDNPESPTSNLESPSVRCDRLLAGYDVNTDSKELHKDTPPACDVADTQAGAFDGKSEQTSREIISPVTGNPIAHPDSVLFNVHSVNDETGAKALVKHHSTDSEDTTKDSDASATPDEEIEKHRLLGLVHNMATRGKIGFRRNLVDEPYNNEERFTVDFIHSNSGLPYDQVKKFINKVSNLVNSKNIEFAFSNNPESSLWFTIKSYKGNKLVFSQEIVSNETDLNDGNKIEMKRANKKITDDQISDSNEKTMTIREEKDRARAEENVSVCSGKVSSNPEYRQSIRDENVLPKKPKTAGNESLISRAEETNEDKTSGAQRMVRKAMPVISGTSAMAILPGLAQGRNNRNHSKLRDRQNINKQGIFAENSPLHTMNQADRKNLSSVAAVETASVSVSSDDSTNVSKAEPVKNQTSVTDSECAGPDHNNRRIRTAKRRLKNVTKVENDPTATVPVQSEAVATIVPVQPETTQLVHEQQIIKQVDEIQPLHFIDTDADLDTAKVEEAPPVYIETDATVDYGRCVVEPGHGERPDKKKLRAGTKEKVKTKGEANKHLKADKENYFPLYDDVIEEYIADEADDMDDSVNIENAPEEQEEGACAVSPVVMNAVDQPQVLDDRELKMVPETIKRVDDPYLVDVEEDYRVSTTHSNKKEKRKQKDDRRKEKKSKKAGQTILKF